MLSAFVILSYAVTYTGAAQFLQLSDFHFDRDYSAQFGNIAEKCHQKSGVKRSKLGQFGDYACDAPKVCLWLYFILLYAKFVFRSFRFEICGRGIYCGMLLTVFIGSNAWNMPTLERRHSGLAVWCRKC